MYDNVYSSITKRRRISKELASFGVKGELLKIVEKNLDHRNAVKIKNRMNKGRTEKERMKSIYCVKEDYSG